MNTRHVIVIGAGVVGLCSAYELRRRGFTVTVLDDGPDATRNCSHGNAGLIVPSHVVPLAAPGMVALGLRCLRSPSSPFGMRPGLDIRRWRWMLAYARHCTKRNVAHAAPVLSELLVASRTRLLALLSEGGWDVALGRGGVLMLSATEASFREEQHAADLARELGLEARVVRGDELQALEPDCPLRAVGGVLYPDDVSLDPDRLMAALREHVRRAGVVLQFDRKVTAIKRENGRITGVQCGTETETCDAAVLAAGAWSAGLVRPLGVDLPLEAGRGHSFEVTAPTRLRHALLLLEARVAVTPMGERVRFAGTMELAGLSTAVNPRRVAGMRASVGSYLPAFTDDALASGPPWAGLRPCTPDGLPYIGRTQRYPNLVVATGHAMLGLSLGPVTGELVAQLLSEERPTVAVEALAPERFN